ncbi:9026_t:CDS:2, partial [Racocetra persica]
DTTPISHWDFENNLTLLALTVIFSFGAAIYLMNLFIGLLSDEISKTNTKESYLILRAEVLEEIELLFMLPHQRRKEDWFPFIIFYECHTIKLRDHVVKIINHDWSGYKKPYISNNLNEVLLLPEKQPSLIRIADAIKELKLSERDIQKDIKELKASINK